MRSWIVFDEWKPFSGPRLSIRYIFECDSAQSESRLTAYSHVRSNFKLNLTPIEELHKTRTFYGTPAGPEATLIAIQHQHRGSLSSIGWGGSKINSYFKVQSTGLVDYDMGTQSVHLEWRLTWTKAPLWTRLHYMLCGHKPAVRLLMITPNWHQLSSKAAT